MPNPGDADPVAAADPYAVLAPVYDAWTGWFADAAALRLAPMLARRGTQSFLDVACGTGRLLHVLRAGDRGMRLCGVDASPAMLAEARRRPNADGSITWRRGSMDGPLPEGPWDATGCFFDAVNHLPDDGAVLRAFCAARAALRDGGAYLLDTCDEGAFKPGRESYSGVGWSLRIRQRWDGRAMVAGCTVMHDGGKASCNVVERPLPPARVRALLQEAGFAVEAEEPDRSGGRTWWMAVR